MPLCYAMLCYAMLGGAEHLGKFYTRVVLIGMCEVTERKETIYVNVCAKCRSEQFCGLSSKL